MSHTYKYPRPAVSVDIFAYRQTEAGLEVLLIERKNEPFAGQWALPGGFLDEKESLEQAAARELQEETGLLVSELVQTKAYSDPNRDPRTRVISVGFMVEAPAGSIAVANDDAAKASWFSLEEMPALAFDHVQIVSDANKLLASIR